VMPVEYDPDNPVVIEKQSLYISHLSLYTTYPYRGTSLIRNHPHVGTCSRPMPRALWWS